MVKVKLERPIYKHTVFKRHKNNEFSKGCFNCALFGMSRSGSTHYLPFTRRTLYHSGLGSFSVLHVTPTVDRTTVLKILCNMLLFFEEKSLFTYCRMLDRAPVFKTDIQNSEFRTSRLLCTPARSQ